LSRHNVVLGGSLCEEIYILFSSPQFELELSGLTFNLNASCPVVIGTIPLRATFSDLMPPPVTKTVEIEPGWESVVTDAEHPGFNPPQFPSGPAGPSVPADFTVPSAPILETYPNLRKRLFTINSTLLGRK
jgi:hypothetical protein